jgi:hypothetical protein
LVNAQVTQPAPVEAEHGGHEQTPHPGEQHTVVRQPGAQRVGHGENPLSQRRLREHVVQQVRGGLGHPPAQARRTEPAPLTAERDEMTLRAAGARHQGEAPAEQAAIEIAVELGAHERGEQGQAARSRTPRRRSIARAERRRVSTGSAVGVASSSWTVRVRGIGSRV